MLFEIVDQYRFSVHSRKNVKMASSYQVFTSHQENQSTPVEVPLPDTEPDSGEVLKQCVKDCLWGIVRRILISFVILIIVAIIAACFGFKIAPKRNGIYVPSLKRDAFNVAARRNIKKMKTTEEMWKLYADSVLLREQIRRGQINPLEAERRRKEILCSWKKCD